MLCIPNYSYSHKPLDSLDYTRHLCIRTWKCHCNKAISSFIGILFIFKGDSQLAYKISNLASGSRKKRRRNLFPDLHKGTLLTSLYVWLERVCQPHALGDPVRVSWPIVKWLGFGMITGCRKPGPGGVNHNLAENCSLARSSSSYCFPSPRKKKKNRKSQEEWKQGSRSLCKLWRGRRSLKVKQKSFQSQFPLILPSQDAHLTHPPHLHPTPTYTALLTFLILLKQFFLYPPRAWPDIVQGFDIGFSSSEISCRIIQTGW